MNELKEFDQLKAEVTVFVGPTKELVVTNPEQSQLATTTVKEVKDWSKKIEERRKLLVKPLNDRVDQINAYAKEVRAPLDAAEAHIKGELLKFDRELAAIRRVAAEKAEAERRAEIARADAKAAEDREAAEAVAMFSKPEEVKVQKFVVDAEVARVRQEQEKAHAEKMAAIESNKVSGVRKTWTFQVTDPSIIPPEFLIVDERAVREAIRNGRREIQGIHIFQETSIAVR